MIIRTPLRSLGAALTVENFNKSLKMAEQINWVREHEESPSLQPIKISCDLMVLDIFSTAISSSFDSMNLRPGHYGFDFIYMKMNDLAENLAWGYSVGDEKPEQIKDSQNPVKGWYYEEKELFLNNKDGHGHYDNIIGDYKYTGVAYIDIKDYSNPLSLTTGQIFSNSI